MLVVANNDDAPANLSVRLPVNKTKAVDLLEPVFGKKQFSIENGQLNISLDACDGTVIFVADEPENIEFSEDTDLSADNIKGSRECCNEEGMESARQSGQPIVQQMTYASQQEQPLVQQMTPMSLWSV